VHLEFFEAVSQQDSEQPKARVYQRFLGRVTFAGRLTVEERAKGNLAEANAVLSAWWAECRGDVKLLQDRYREVKEIGQRSLEAQPSRRLAGLRTTSSSIPEDVSLDDRPTANVKVGRNAPCPCGSGKKYKKCCWRKAAIPLQY
jgi:hypothetical protein